MGEMLLDRYRVLDEVDSGGFGEVVLAFDERIRRRVAIKKLPLSPRAGEQTGLKEARTAALLNHPNIVAVYDFDIDDERSCAYLIMEYVDGLTLADIPAEYLTEEIIAAIARTVCAALSYAHNNGVLHLDIKPANILINHQGQIKLADFGMARLSAPRKYGRAIGGTVGYMALEQLCEEEVSPATDQWATAAVLYQLVTGEYPYQHLLKRGAGFDAMLAAQTAAEPALLTTHSAELDAVLSQALTRNPTLRFSDIESFAQALLPALDGSEHFAEGQNALRLLVAEFIRDDASSTADRYANRHKPQAPGCGAVCAFLTKLLLACAVATLVLAGLTPQLFGDKRTLILQVAGGAAILLGTLRLVVHLFRRKQ
jgi:serine/threonine-protein kinase